jgi:hypothetical protein
MGLGVLAVFIITTKLILWFGLAPTTRPKHDESVESLIVFFWFTFGFFATWLYEFWEFRHQARFQVFFAVELLLHCIAWRGLYLWIGPYTEHRFWLYSLTLLEVWIFGKFLLASVGLEEFENGI